MKAIFEKRAATVEVDTFISPGFRFSVPAVLLQNGFFFVFSTASQERTVPVSVPGKRFRRFWFRFQFREERF